MALATARCSCRCRLRAAELLDSLLHHHLAELLLPLVEGRVDKVAEIAGTRLHIARMSPSGRLAELAESSDPWLRACAIARIGALDEPPLASLVTAALQSDDELVCEAALRACKEILKPAQFINVLNEQVSASAFPSVRRYAEALLLDTSAA